MLQRVLLDQLAVDVGALVLLRSSGTSHGDIDDQRVVAADGCVVDADVIVRRRPIVWRSLFMLYSAITWSGSRPTLPCASAFIACPAEPTQDLVEILVRPEKHP
jgi:hypothetical protein